jgi:hypothetical protein
VERLPDGLDRLPKLTLVDLRGSPRLHGYRFARSTEVLR